MSRDLPPMTQEQKELRELVDEIDARTLGLHAVHQTVRLERPEAA